MLLMLIQRRGLIVSERNSLGIPEVPNFDDVVEAFHRLRDQLPTVRDLGQTATNVKDGLSGLAGVTARYVAYEAKSSATDIIEAVGYKTKWGAISLKGAALGGLKSIIDDLPHLGDRK